jgi:hypothetical protein
MIQAAAASSILNLSARYWKVALGGGVAIAFLYIIWQWTRPLAYRLFGQVPNDAPMLPGGGDVAAEFEGRAAQKINQLRKAIRDDSWFGSDLRCNTFNEVLGFNDNQLTLIHNLYKNRYGITLFSDLNSISGDGCVDFDFFGEEATAAIRDRLSKLALV